jgi:hypothetical protein
MHICSTLAARTDMETNLAIGITNLLIVTICSQALPWWIVLLNGVLGIVNFGRSDEKPKIATPLRMPRKRE